VKECFLLGHPKRFLLCNAAHVGSDYFHNGTLLIGTVNVSVNSLYKFENPARLLCLPCIGSLFVVFNPRCLRLYLINSAWTDSSVADGFRASFHSVMRAEVAEGDLTGVDTGFCVVADCVFRRSSRGLHATVVLEGACARVALA